MTYSRHFADNNRHSMTINDTNIHWQVYMRDDPGMRAAILDCKENETNDYSNGARNDSSGSGSNDACICRNGGARHDDCDGVNMHIIIRDHYVNLDSVKRLERLGYTVLIKIRK